MQVKKYEEDIFGKKLSVEIGKLAGQANGSCVVRYEDTVVLVTATMSAEAKDMDYFPLNVGYEEKYYAAGKIKGSKWIKRESRPSDDAILSGRLIDRAIRPRFDHNIRNEVQVVATVLSFDEKNDPDIVALFGSSLALMISDIPFDGPVAGVRVARIDGKLIFNPSYEERTASDIDIVVAGTKDYMNMLEAGSRIVPEQEMEDAIVAGFKEIQKLTSFQEKIAKDINTQKSELKLPEADNDLQKIVREFSEPKLQETLYIKDKTAFKQGLEDVKNTLIDHVATKYDQDEDLKNKKKMTMRYFEEEIDRVIHENVLKSEKRPDGRKLNEVRDISTEAGVLPMSHGTGLFNRGQTQALSFLTLAAPGLEQWIETMELNLTKKRFMHHYVFPPFSVGETGRIGFTGRREIGHGALAEKALEPIIPEKDKFPYTIRIVSEILSSNGSSSMASVCGSSLALMDGGVPIKEHVAGIAMGLIIDQKTRDYKVLTDIQGPEDHYGDMDLKVAGTKDGVTAIQMDVKIDGINQEMLHDALTGAKEARMHILGKMNDTLSVPRETLSPHAPRIKIISINPEKIGLVIGPGGKNINKIIDETGATIDIEDDGMVFITGETDESINLAMDRIKEITFEVKPEEIYDGKVAKIMDFGAFVEIVPGQSGLVHVSEMKEEHVQHPKDVVAVGDIVKVKVKNIDDHGRINLTMKGLNK